VVEMMKEKDFKRLFTISLEDKLKNTLMMLIYLKRKDGAAAIRDYYGNAIPEYLLDYEGLGAGKRMMIKTWLKTNPHGYMKKIFDGIKEDQEFMVPLEKYKILKDTKKEISVEINCNFIRALEKSGKKFKCDFDLRECYCKDACTPMMKKVFENFFLQAEVTFTETGCIRTVLIPDETVSEKE
jgi:hypothetical protein